MLAVLWVFNHALSCGAQDHHLQRSWMHMLDTKGKASFSIRCYTARPWLVCLRLCHLLQALPCCS
jgi:hypothetical protein